MSADIYFCFCCLSTNDLSCLYSDNTESNYAAMLQELFNISISSEDYEYDGHICKVCIQSLKDIHKFKSTVFEILNILQSNGLIELSKENDTFTIKKVTQENLQEPEEKHDTEQNKEFVLFEDLAQEIKDRPKTIKEEDQRQEEKTIDSILKDEDNDRKIERLEVTRVHQYEVTEDLKCSICSMVLPNVYMFHSHMNQHYPNHICETCGKGFLTEKRLKRHKPSHKGGLFTCQSCDAVFSNYNTLNSHRQRKHSSVLLYKCPHCSQRFGTFTQRAAHLAAEHQMTYKYGCHVCDKKFLIAGNLSSHMRNTHVKVKRHPCAHCGAAFTRKQDLAAHSATHTGLMAYHCDVCHKRYPRKKSLIVHMRTHTNDRRFACEVCGKKFVQKCTLLVHAKTHNRVLEKTERSEVPHISIEYGFVS